MTLKKSSLFSEPYGSTGNIGDNFLRLLGTPSLDPLQTVIRESLQNTADAAKLGVGPEVHIRLRKLNVEQKAVLSSRLLQELPNEHRSQKMIEFVLSQENPVVMEICDFNTVGLGGPTRSDRIPAGTTKTDFIDFLRNIGTARDTSLGGGTYGFGKVALYRASLCSTIIVDTFPQSDNGEGRRLMACHIGHSFDIAQNGMQRRFTGRHWWGVPDPVDSVVEPFTDSDAEWFATALGFPERSKERTGTSIMILGFDMGDESMESFGNRIAETILYNFWPRMMHDTPVSRRFNCRLEVDGNQVDIPSPESFPPLDLFTKAMRAARSKQGNDVREIQSKRPAKLLGTLAIEKGLRSTRRVLVNEDSQFSNVSHHIALMRPVELVVKYLEGGALPDERLEWAGVFITNNEDEIERAFADSEPPAHDDWVPDNLPKGPVKTIVNVALRELRMHAAELGIMGNGRPSASSTDTSPLAKVAGRLGAALEGVGGDGAGRKRNNGTTTRTPRPLKARATPPQFIRLEMGSCGKVAVFETLVRQDRKRSGYQLSAQAAVCIDGGATQRNVQLVEPSVLKICSVDGGPADKGSVLLLDRSEGRFEIHVLLSDDFAVTVNADVRTKGSS